MKRFLLAAAAACALAVASGPAQALVVGVADSASSYPFGSFGAGPYFQELYSAADFSGPLSINRISFYNSKDPANNKPLADTFTFFLSTTNAPVATFDTDAMVYPDASFTQVYSGKATLLNGRLDFNLSSAFNYNPALGNLLLTVRDFDYGSGGTLQLDADFNTAASNIRIYNFGYNFNQGLVTGFNDPIPEPASWALMIAGFGLAGATLRRKRQAAATAA